MIALVLILAGINMAMALEVEVDYKGTQSGIFVNRLKNGTIGNIQYPITSTGATSGIRYRTTEITFAIDNDDSHYQGSINAQTLVNVQPGPGQSIKSLVTFDVNDIMQALGVPADKVSQVQGFFVKDPNALKIGAVIEIFNASTGEVLDTIYSEDQIDLVAAKHGFGPGDIEDMHSRFIGGKFSEPPLEPEAIAGDGLHFQAISQRNTALGKTIDPPRKPDTAKWTDTVTATLTPSAVIKKVDKDFVRGKGIIAPPAPSKHGCSPMKNYSILDEWCLMGGILKHPSQNPEFTFGDPQPPVGVTPNNNGKPILLSNSPGGYETVRMGATDFGHKLTCQFKENWAMNGTLIHDILNPHLDSWIQTPQTYEIVVSDILVKVKYTEVIYRWVMVADGWDCIPVSEGKEAAYFLGDVTGYLLVDGTGVASIGM